MKNVVNKKIWKTTVNSKCKTNIVINKFLWFFIVVIFASIIYLNSYSPVIINLTWLSTVFIIFNTLLLLFIFSFTIQGFKCWNLLLSSRLEISKIIWPSSQEIIHSTVIVLLILVISSLLIYFIGLIFMYIISYILSI